MGVEDLNKEQRQAATAGEGPVMIVAGPGTGKTKTLTARMVFLIEEQGVAPEQILALTFTKKAAEEMQARVAGSLAGKTPQITTFHALCHALLGGNLTFIGEPERLRLIKNLARPAALKHLSVRELGLLISRAKNTPEASKDSALKKIVDAYNQQLHVASLHDFDDLLLDVYTLLGQDAKARAAVRARFQHILVDEFQDTNGLQYELLKLIRGNDNVFVIGDPNQSIYGFRGASGGIFDRFIADFPNTQKITLHVNYRSCSEVVRLANAVFDGESHLTAHAGRGGHVRRVLTLNEYSEANWVRAEIQRAIGGGDFLHAVSDDQRDGHRRLSDFAVLYRSRSCVLALHKAFAASGLPYQIVGEGSPYEQPLIQEIIALLRAFDSGADVSVQKLRSSQCRVLLERVDKTLPPAKIAHQIIELFGFEPGADLAQLTSLLVRFDDLSSALAYLDRIAEGNFYDPAADAVTLLTIHAAKGLEFPHVFLAACEEEILPHKKADLSEEHRLFYVAVTRARERLDILYAKFRGGEPATPSSFLNMPAAVLPSITDPELAQDERRAQKRKLKRSQQTLF